MRHVAKMKPILVSILQHVVFLQLKLKLEIKHKPSETLQFSGSVKSEKVGTGVAKYKDDEKSFNLI